MMSETLSPLLECRGISKQFGTETVLDQVDLSLYPGEVHGVVGANGAGKSTLMKILAGALPDHDGQILLDGHKVELSSPQAALGRGIAMVYQELSGVGSLSVAENLCLGRQPVTRLGRIDWGRMKDQARQYLGELQIDIDVSRRLDRYPLAVRQMVEIARGLHSGAKVLLLDEPTSALSPIETQRLFALLERLRSRRMAIVLISHFIEDVLSVCDRVTILQDGRRVITAPANELNKPRVIELMLGHKLDPAERSGETGVSLPPRRVDAPVLKAHALALSGVFSEIDLQLSPGECLGLYGFVGAGHQELAHALAGGLHPTGGRMELDSAPLRLGSTHAAVQRGVVLVTADRGQSLCLKAEIFKNVTLAHLRYRVGDWLRTSRELAVVQPMLERVGCHPANPMLPAGSLSGGNQQKVVLSKWLLRPVRVLVLDEPTRGMDVKAKAEVMHLVHQLRSQGTAVVLSSSEPEMLLAHADRILVMRRGQITQEFVGQSVDKGALMRSA